MYRTISKVVVISLLLSVFAFSFEPFFNSRIDYPMGGYIDCLTSADFNNDGYIDFACGSDTYTGVYFTHINIYINRGNGTYFDPVAIESGKNITSINYGDFNGDGWIDLYTVTDSYNDLNIFMNQGDGTFIKEQTYPGFGGIYLVALDMDNNGNDDLIKIDVPDINVYFSNGDGTFAIGASGEEIWYTAGGVYGKAIPWDINHDNYPDLLIYGNKVIYTDAENYYLQPMVTTHLNNQDSTFLPATEFLHGDSTDVQIVELETGFFDSDDERDVLITDYQSNRVILLNEGDGSFTIGGSFVKDRNLPLKPGDVNGDNFCDLILSNSEKAVISVFMNNGSDDISFADSVDYSGKWGVNPTFRIQLMSTDINNDYYDDFILYNWNLSTVFNHGDGTFPLHNALEDMGTDYHDILSEDFDGDGSTDLLAYSGSINIKYNDGDGNFSGLYTTGGGSGDQSGIFSGFFDADDFVDFGVVSPTSFILYYGNEEGGFEPNTDLHDTLDFFGGYGGIAAEFNDDGFTDYATYYSGSGTQLFVVLSDSNGGYRVFPYSMGGNLETSIAVGDLDNDDDLDIVTTAYNNNDPGGPGAISIRYNNGDGDFSSISTKMTEYMAMGVILEDLNGDNYVDMAVTQYGTYDGYISVYLNNQDGTFPTQENYGQLYAPAYRNIKSADMDKDGDMDLLASIEAYDQIAVFLNDADGTFPEIQYYAGGDGTQAFSVANLDSDSTMDIAVASSVTDRDYVFLYFNSGLNLLPPTSIDDPESGGKKPGEFHLFQNYPNPFNPTTIINYHLTAYSKVDLSVYNTLGQKISTLISKKQKPGMYEVEWDASSFASGVYFYRLQTANISEIKKMVLIK